MKSITVLGLLSTFMLQAYGQVEATLPNSQSQQEAAKPEVVNFRVTERGQDFRRYEWETRVQTADGKVVIEPHSYTELANGLHYKHGNDWLETREEFSLVPGWAVARKGPHKVSLAYNLNVRGAVAVELPDGRLLRSQVIALAYLDRSSGQSVMLGEIKDCGGSLLPPNQILYADAFAGVKADIRYTYRKSGLSQDIVLRQDLPSPGELGLNAETTRLTVITEFVEGPSPEMEPVISGGGDAQNITGRGADLAEADWLLRFGEMHMAQGRAFVLGDEKSPARLGEQVPVIKKWVEQDGRRFLFEEVPVSEVKGELEKLPRQSSLKKKWSRTLLASLKLPVLSPSRGGETGIFRIKNDGPHTAGYVLDYELVGAALTNATFRADMTYYISGTVNLHGQTTFEGGSVLKYNPAAYHQLTVKNGPVNWEAGPYRPVVFTSKDDNSIGEYISGSSGAPTVNHNDSYYLVLENVTNASLQNLRMHYGNCSLTTLSCSNITVADLQILHSNYPVYPVSTTGLRIRNALLSDTPGVAFYVDASDVSVEHLTLSQCAALGFKASSVATIAITNSLFVGVQSLGDVPLTTNCVTIPSSSNGVFQTVGGGSHYLSTNSSYRDAGTTNISPELLASLKAKTTCPPVVYSNVTFNTPATLSPQAQRDADAPDLGYHYDPLDYVIGGCVLNSTLSVTNDTVVAWFDSLGSVYAYGQPYGMALNNGASLTFDGLVMQPAWFVHFTMAQEGNGTWLTRGWMPGLMLNGTGSSPRPQISCKFTKWFVAAGFSGLFRDKWNYGNVYASHSEFLGGSVATYGASTYFTNCLFNRMSLYFYGDTDATSITLLNCTFREGAMIMKRFSWGSPSFWLVANTAFDGTSLTTYDQFNSATNRTYYDYNAFNPSNSAWITHPFSWYGAPKTNVLAVAGAHDVVVTNYNWQSGALGDHYLPDTSALIDAGGQAAYKMGLHHFTTQTNQVRELGSKVDIGFHYVALDGAGDLFDTDGDGTPDYLDLDSDNDGVDDVTELAQGRNALVAGAVADTGGATGLRLFTPLK